MQSYKQLQVWQKGVAIVKHIYKVTEWLPKQEQFGLVGQMRRAAVSIPCNIAEGFARQTTTRDYAHFLSMAMGSCAELETHVVIASELMWLSAEQVKALEEELDHESRMLKALIKSLTKGQGLVD